MTNHRYDTYCGIYCGACEIINARTGQEKESVAKHWGSTPEEVKCSGCKTDNLFIRCGKCKIRSCAQEKGIELCLDCKEYPCKIYEEGKAIVEQLPHLKANLSNMNFIKANGVNNWLDEQKKQWKCPQCETQFAWYTIECKGCKKDLTGIKDYENLEIDL